MRRLSTLRTTGKLPTAILAAAFLSLLGLSQSAEAAVVWIASEVSGSLVLTATGDLDVSGTVHSVSDTGPQFGFIGTTTTYGHTGPSLGAPNVGTYQTIVVGSNARATTVSGQTFGHNFEMLVWDISLGTGPALITPNTVMAFNSHSLADVYGTSLDAGPVLLWTHDVTGDTISVALEVPEPSGVSLIVLGTVGLLLKRRRALHPSRPDQ